MNTTSFSASNVIVIFKHVFLLLVDEGMYCRTLTLMLSYCSVMFAQGNGLDLSAPLFPLKNHLQSSQPFSPAQALSGGYSNRTAMSRLIPRRESSTKIAQTSASVVDTARTEWMTTHASGLAPGSEVVNAMAVDASGNVFITGFSTHLPYGSDIATIKYDSTGTQIWLQRFSEKPDGINSGVAIALTNAGEVYVAGTIVGSDGSADWVIIKYSSSGSMLWKAHYAGVSASSDNPVALKLDSHENVVVTGYGDAEFITAKFNPSGNQIWVVRYTSAPEANGRPAAMAIDKTDNIYVTGSVGIGYLYDYMTVKYDASGNIVWTARYDGPAKNEDSPCGIVVDDAGNVIVTGTVTTDLARTFQVGTIKYDSRGIEQWRAFYGAGQHYDVPHDIAIDILGNIYVAGRSDSANFGDGILLKYSSMGTLLWKDRHSAGDYDEFFRVVVDSHNNVYVTGSSRYNSSTNLVTLSYTPNGSRRWIARFGSGGEPRALCVDALGNTYVGTPGEGGGYDYVTLKYDASGAQRWIERYDGPGSTYEYPQQMTVDQQGNSYVTGVSFVRSGGAVFAAKFSTHGVLQWASKYEGPSTNTWPADTKVDESGNVYVLATNSMNGGCDYVTLKYNALGTQLWAARYPHVQGGDNYAVALALDQHGNVIVTGATYEVTHGGHYTTVKYSPEGKRLWIAQYPISTSFNDTPRAMTVNSLGEIIVVGAVQGQCLTIKYSEDGREEWIARYQPSPQQACWPEAMALDRQGNIIVTGACALETINPDCLTLKYNPLGKLVWMARYDGPTHKRDTGKMIAADDAGNIYIGGDSFGTSHNTLMLIKYNSVGTQQWVAQPGLPEGTDNWVSSVDIDSSGYILLSATYSDALRTTTFGADGSEKRTTAYPVSGQLAFDRSGHLHVAGLRWVGPQAIVVAGEFSTSSLPPPDNSHLMPLVSTVSQNFPNPFNGSTIINFTLARAQKVDLRIYDVLGRTVATLVSGELEKGDHYAVWNASNVASGIYYYRLQAEEYVRTKKMVLQK